MYYYKKVEISPILRLADEQGRRQEYLEESQQHQAIHESHFVLIVADLH